MTWSATDNEQCQPSMLIMVLHSADDNASIWKRDVTMKALTDDDHDDDDDDEM